MRKIRLDTEKLVVETFSVTKIGQGKHGTVRANGADYTGWSCETWERGCGGTGFGENTCDLLASCDTHCAWGTTCYPNAENGTC
jgi:DNA primase large subunit